MTMACWPDEGDPFIPVMADMIAHIATVNAEYARLWPHHCKACGGWGGSSFQESHGFKGGGSETIFDPCGSLGDNQCHRCLAEGLSEDGDGPCTACGWNYDDGMLECG